MDGAEAAARRGPVAQQRLVGIAATVAWWICGCASAPPLFVPSASAAGAPLPAVPAESVRVVTLDYDEPHAGLPEGLLFGDGEVRAMPGYPVAGREHRVVGNLYARYPREGAGPATLTTMRAIAGAHGADTLLLVGPDAPRYSTRYDGGHVFGVALVLSTEAPPARPSVEALLAEPGESLEGYVRRGTSQLDLSEPMSLEIEGAPSTCYGVLLALDAQAELTPLGFGRGLSIRVRGTDVTDAGWYPRSHDERSESRQIGCSREGGPITAAISQGRRGVGRGTLFVQVFSRALNAAQVRERDAMWEAAREEGQRGQERLIQRDCQRCRTELDVCWRVSPTMSPSECRPFARCLERFSLSRRPDQCSFR